MLFYRETNSKSGKIYLLSTLKYTWCAYLSPPFLGISRHKSLQFVKKSNMTLLPLLAGSPGFTLCFPLIPVISEASHAIIDTNANEYLPCIKIFVYVELTILQYVTFVVTNCCFSGSVAVQSGLLLQRY